MGNKNITVRQIIKSALKKLIGPILKRYYLILEKLDYITNKVSLADEIVELNRGKFCDPNMPLILEKLDYITNKLSLVDEIVELNRGKFCDPNTPLILEKLDYIANKLSLFDASLILGKLDYIINKLSLADEIVELKGARFYVPMAPRDTIQNCLLSNSAFYELDILQSIDKILTRDSIVIDIGANIGNHTVYWGKITNVKRIYSFEPVKSTFNILSRNIEINNLNQKVMIYNVGLSDRTSRGTVVYYLLDNIGGTPVHKSDDGDIKLERIDNIKEINDEAAIDFVKIDVEGGEKDVLNGGVEFFNKYKPMVFIESVKGINQYEFTYDFFKKLDYREPINYPNDNYLFIHKNTTHVQCDLP
jgi:FkbM family methyltransferase